MTNATKSRMAIPRLRVPMAFASTTLRAILSSGALLILTPLAAPSVSDWESVGDNPLPAGNGAVAHDLAANGTLKPIVSERIPLAEATRAHELLAHGRHAGKVVLTTAQPGPGSEASSWT